MHSKLLKRLEKCAAWNEFSSKYRISAVSGAQHCFCKLCNADVGHVPCFERQLHHVSWHRVQCSSMRTWDVEGCGVSHSKPHAESSHDSRQWITLNCIVYSNSTWRLARMKVKAHLWDHRLAVHCRWLNLSRVLVAVPHCSVPMQFYARANSPSSCASSAIIFRCRERCCHVVTHVSAPSAFVSIENDSGYNIKCVT